MSLVFGPHKFLNEKSKPFLENEFGEDLQGLGESMISLMKALGGVGLAGVQVGIQKRILVADISGTDVIMINPSIKFKSETKKELEEGCLSLPLQTFKITRPDEISVEYKTPMGALVEESFFDIDAAIVQHEIDHLDGITLLEKVSRLKKDIYKRKFKKFRKKIGK